jgi:lipopolysaccharide transport system ATP-binding protein
MSSDAAVEVQHLVKRYRIGRRESYTALRDVLAGAFSAPVRRLKGTREPQPEFAALDDVSFSVARGEVLGLVGANGAGKSTLLKVLSKITEPTEGRVLIRGRVGSLLEVGTGFHPELTGRENIFLNGTILGMRRAEIVRRFDEIVEFSGVSQFLDTPVKRYSSGMQVRLAFAVAAHLEPEILLVDEVLAVGDAEFQQRCLGRMREVTNEGRTVVFVSHNLAAVRALCSRAVVLESGRLVFDGPTDEAVQHYLGFRDGGSGGAVEGAELELHLTKAKAYSGEPFFRCDRVAALDESGAPSIRFRSDEQISIAVDYTVLRPVPSLRILVTLSDENQATLLRTESIDDPEAGVVLAPGSYRTTVTIPRDLLGDAVLDLNVSLISEVNQVLDYAAVLNLEVDFAGLAGNMRGKAYLRPRLDWSTEPVGAVGAAAER